MIRDDEKRYDVFISFAHRDYENTYEVDGAIVKEVISNNPILQIVDLFESAGISYWYDQEGVSDDFLKTIKREIDASRVLVFVSSRYSNESAYTPDEINYAKKLRMPIIPFKIDKTDFNEDFGLALASKNTIETYMTNPEGALKELEKCVKKSLEKIKIDEKKKLQKQIEKEKKEKEIHEREEKEHLLQKQLKDKEDRLIEVQNQLLHLKASRTKLEYEQRTLSAEINNLKRKQHGFDTKIMIPLFVIILLLIAGIIVYFTFFRDVYIHVENPKINCAYIDTTVNINVRSNVNWELKSTKGDFYTIKKIDNSAAKLEVFENRTSIPRYGSIDVQTKNGKVKETIELRQKSMPEPSAEILDVAIERNVTRKGEIGAVISVNVLSKYLKGNECTVSIYFSSKGEYIKSKSMKYSKDGYLAPCERYKPLMDKETQKCEIFIPYSEIPKEYRSNCKCSAVILLADTTQLTYSEWLTFHVY